MTVTDLVRATKPKVVLEAIDLHQSDQFQDLMHQRTLCGWNNEPAVLEKWRAASDRGEKSMVWIHLPSPPAAGEPPAQEPREHLRRRIGHISFQSVPDLGEPDSDPELARLDKTVLMVSTFFVLHEHRGGRVGTAAMEALEAMTQVAPYGSPKCHTLTLHTKSRCYTDDDGDDSPDAWRYSRAIWDKLGCAPLARGSSTEDWYARMGYVKWKEEPRYPDKLPDGTPFSFLASFLRKDVSRKSAASGL